MSDPTPALSINPTMPVRLLDSRNSSDVLRVVLQSDGPGVLEVPELDGPRIAIHVGRPVRTECRHGARRYSGLAIHGDIDIIPGRTCARWEMKETDTALILRIAPHLLTQVAEECGMPGRTEVCSHFRLRDPQIEHIGWAVLAEVQRGYPCGPLYMESMARALAVRLLRTHSAGARTGSLPRGGMPRHKLLQVQSYIEENLRGKLSLDAIALAAGISPSHLKATFRQATGMPVHQYVIHRRVERAAQLLREGRLPISQIALDVGFAHQSHLALHMKRLLGVSPTHISRGVA